ncbi:hypothetical protein DFJ73DRAFT_812376 [Zopfochytrium polystomum]|nr:hypothetical protein DFJ73DRAFT_812376 [Zopfochytrium polystomum]
MLGTFFVWVLVALLLPIYLFTTRIGKPRAVPVGAEKPGEGKLRRNVRSLDALSTTPIPDVKTVYDILSRAVRLTPNKNIIGYRSLVRIVEEEKEVTKVVAGVEKKEIKKWKYFELSKYNWLTYAQVNELAVAYGAGLKQLGLNHGDKVTLYAGTSYEWMIFAHAAFTQGLTITTAYDTLGEEGLTFSLLECEITTIFTNADLLPMIVKISSTVKTIKSVLEAFRTGCSHIKLLSLAELKTLGQQNPAPPSPPKPDDIACIMYTFWNNRQPKRFAGIAGAKYLIVDYIGSEDYYLAYLPLAHILEFTVEMACFHLGITLGYGSVKTLTGCIYIKELQPTLMAGVPAVWETIRKGVLVKLREASPVQQKIFNFAVDLKWTFLGLGLPTGWIDAIVFNKVKSQTGGRLKFALSGGAPIPKSTQRFLTCSMCPIVNGYGMTECCAVAAVQNIDQASRLGIVGPPVTSMEIKLVDVPDTSYSSKNVPRPQGEIWLRGPSIMRGYYKQPQQTKETITDDGWLMTGDIGEWQPDGSLSVIDRKKNLVKLANGEYIALEKLESVYKTSSYVQNIVIYGDSEQSFPVAIIQPNEKEIHHLVQELKLFTDPDSVDIAELVKPKQVTTAVLANLKDIAKRVGLPPAEVVQAAYIAGEEWTPQNGLLTAAMKLKRKDLIARYQSQINKMYGK